VQLEWNQVWSFCKLNFKGLYFTAEVVRKTQNSSLKVKPRFSGSFTEWSQKTLNSSEL
jgi:hypothetical protein